MRMRLLTMIVTLTVAIGVSSAGGVGAPGDGVVGWRTDGTGRYPDADPPREFSATEGVVWAAPMPSWSNASPVVLPDRIFVCAEPDILLAVEKESGKILWQSANPVAETENAKEQPTARKLATHPHNGFTSATPVTDGRRVFAVFGSGVVSAYDIDGERLWSRFVEQPLNKWGHSASPVLVGGTLLVHFETLVALDPADGTERWRQPAETWVEQRKKRWGTPAPARIGETDVVITTRGNVVRVSDAEILYRELAPVQYSTPLVTDGVAYFFDQAGGRAVRLPEEVGGEPEVLWNAKTVRDRYYASPLLHEGVIYTITRRGHFSAFDAETGEEIYQEKLLLAATEKVANAAYTSPTLGGRVLYFAGMDGSVVVVRPGRKYEQLARNRVEEGLRTTPVFEGTRMYLRAPGALYCFGR
jgi:outer membrane protein assembly factor BamB